MKLALDAEERFVLTALGSGWELEVDGQRVHYCRDPLAALRYLSEELREEMPVNGVREVVAALNRIDETIDKAVQKMQLSSASQRLCHVLRASLDEATRREHVRDTSLAMAGCKTVSEFQARPDAKDIVTDAKAVLEPWFEKMGV